MAPYAIFPLSVEHFGAIQSSAHSQGTTFLASALNDLIRFFMSDCFDAFPFPRPAVFDSEGNQLESLGEDLKKVSVKYCETRAELMVGNNEGVTSTYNRFDDPAETSGGIVEPRRLHEEMDQAVLAAYGWSGVPIPCGFGLDYLNTEDDALDFQGQLQAYGAITGRRKLPWRYRWP